MKEKAAATNIRSEGEIALQVLRFYNGAWLTTYEIVKEVKLIDRRFSGNRVISALTELANEGKILRKYKSQLVMYGVSDGTRPTRLYPSQPQPRPGVRRGDRDPRHEEGYPFEPWEENANGVVSEAS